MKYTVTGQSTLKLVSLLDSCKIFYKYSKCVFYSSNLAQIFCRSMYVLAETNLPIHGKHILRALRAVEHQIFKHSLCRQLMESPHQPTSKLDDDSHKSHHCSILYTAPSIQNTKFCTQPYGEINRFLLQIWYQRWIELQGKCHNQMINVYNQQIFIIK